VCRQSRPLIGDRVFDIDLLGDLYRVIDLDAEVANRAFYPMARWP